MQRVGQKKNKKEKTEAALIERVTELADALMQLGYFGAYDDDYEKISSVVTGGKTQSEYQWRYKWQLDGQVFGPFTAQQMHDWQQQGFFQAPVYVQRISADDDEAVGEYELSTNVRFM